VFIKVVLPDSSSSKISSTGSVSSTTPRWR